jgi:mono/diheme cytochrome c family protein
MVLVVVGSLGGIAIACGGESEGGATPPATASGTGSGSGSGSGSGTTVAAGDFTGPEYEGDHSLPGDPAAGEAVYRQSCLACHAENGRGNGGITGADFVGDRRRLAKNNDTLLHSIREGVNAQPAMPAHRDLLTDQQMRDALSYVRQRFGQQGS